MNDIQAYVSTQALQRINMTVLSNKERTELFVLWEEYNKYVQQFCQNIFSFEDFVSHTTGKVFLSGIPLESEYITPQTDTKNPI